MKAQVKFRGEVDYRNREVFGLDKCRIVRLDEDENISFYEILYTQFEGEIKIDIGNTINFHELTRKVNTSLSGTPFLLTNKTVILEVNIV